MVALCIRPMQEAEFETYRSRRIRDYAAAQVSAGIWAPDVAQDRARRAFQQLLPDGTATRNALLFTGERSDGAVVGSVWVTIEGDLTGCEWLSSVEVLPGHRGRGYGRALLSAAELELRQRGIERLELSVFGSNEAARGLFETSGFETVSIRMRKTLSRDQY